MGHWNRLPLLWTRLRLTYERGWVSWSSWSSWGVAWVASLEDRSAGFSGDEAVRAVPAPHTTTKAALHKQNTMTVSAQLKNWHSRGQMQTTVTGVTSEQTNPRSEKLVHKPALTLLSYQIESVIALHYHFNVFYTSYKHSAQSRRHKRTCLSWVAQRWRMGETQGYGTAVVSEKKMHKNSFHTNGNVTETYRRCHSQRWAKNNKISILFGYFYAKA